MSEYFSMSLELLSSVINEVIPKLFFRIEVNNKTEVATLYIPRGYGEKVRSLISGSYLRVRLISPTRDYCIKYFDLLLVEEV